MSCYEKRKNRFSLTSTSTVEFNMKALHEGWMWKAPPLSKLKSEKSFEKRYFKIIHFMTNDAAIKLQSSAEKGKSSNKKLDEKSCLIGLAYWKPKEYGDDSKPQRVINLKDCDAYEENDSQWSRIVSSMFKLKTHNRTFFFAAENEVQKTEWISKLNEAIKMADSENVYQSVEEFRRKYFSENPGIMWPRRRGDSGFSDTTISIPPVPRTNSGSILTTSTSSGDQDQVFSSYPHRPSSRISNSTRSSSSGEQSNNLIQQVPERLPGDFHGTDDSVFQQNSSFQHCENSDDHYMDMDDMREELASVLVPQPIIDRNSYNIGDKEFKRFILRSDEEDDKSPQLSSTTQNTGTYSPYTCLPPMNRSCSTSHSTKSASHETSWNSPPSLPSPRTQSWPTQPRSTKGKEKQLPTRDHEYSSTPLRNTPPPIPKTKRPSLNLELPNQEFQRNEIRFQRSYSHKDSTRIQEDTNDEMYEHMQKYTEINNNSLYTKVNKNKISISRELDQTITNEDHYNEENGDCNGKIHHSGNSRKDEKSPRRQTGPSSKMCTMFQELKGEDTTF